jgi:hypothetical protein
VAVLSRKEQRGTNSWPENRRAVELDKLSAAALEAVVERHDEREG